jgi:hypothetical protein
MLSYLFAWVLLAAHVCSQIAQLSHLAFVQAITGEGDVYSKIARQST